MQVPEKRLTLEVQNGFVTLKGEVNWYFQRKAAQENLRKLTGVVGVSNQITISLNLTAKEVRSKIESALQRRAVRDARQIIVDVEGRTVTLRGEVHSWAEREDAELDPPGPPKESPRSATRSGFDPGVARTQRLGRTPRAPIRA